MNFKGAVAVSRTTALIILLVSIDIISSWESHDSKVLPNHERLP